MSESETSSGSEEWETNSSSSSSEEDDIFDAITVGESKKPIESNSQNKKQSRKRLSKIKDDSVVCVKRCKTKLFGKKKCKTKCRDTFKTDYRKELKKLRLKETREKKQKEKIELEKQRRKKKHPIEIRLVHKKYDLKTWKVGELKPKQGQIIVVLSKRTPISYDKNWWFGRIRFTNTKGLFDSSKTKSYNEGLKFQNSNSNSNFNTFIQANVDKKGGDNTSLVDIKSVKKVTIFADKNDLTDSQKKSFKCLKS